MKRTYLALAGALALLIIALALKGQLLALPEVRSEAAAGQFDTARAVERLRRILGDEAPHPVDSPAGDAVRERLLAEMRSVGLDPRVTDDFACNSHPRFRAVTCARVRNIVATMGPADGRHVLAVAHYDSSPVGPGAADDGIGVAVLLETAAQLRGRPLARPVTLLINEGEEAGLIGARAFLERHPIAGQVESLVNFEARGVTGPAIMFETSQPNGRALAAFARDVDRPFANSLTTDFYRLIPNSTDVAVFEERGWTTLNFAVIGNETRYHSAGDDLAALDRRSVQHMGDQALAVVAGLAAQGAAGSEGARHYTDVLGRWLVVLPALASFAMLGALLLFFGWTAWSRRAGLGLAAAAVVAGLVDSAIFGWIGQFTVGLFRVGHWWRAHPELVALAVSLSALAACTASMILARNVPVDRLRAAYWLVFLLLGAAATAVAPGAAILFLFPALAAALGIAAARRWPRAERIGAIVAALILFTLFAPLLEMLETLLGHGSAWMFAPLAAAILWPWLIELKPLFGAGKMRWTSSAVGAAALAGWTAAAAVPAYSEDRQQRFSIEYAWDSDARRGQWATVNDGAPLPEAYSAAARWSGSREVPWGTARRWTAPAPALPVEAPSLSILAQREVPEGRLVTLRLESAGAQSVTLRAAPEAQLRSVRAGAFTRRMGEGTPEDPWIVRCTGRSCDGAQFEVLMANRSRAEWTLFGFHDRLPAAARPLLEARPVHGRPQYGADGTIAYRRVRF
ncbi:M28 family peptidase [Allosphingosinicella sp.]|jgi:hypothetical protein|uniref:M28 family peptidase n=1 Tax=Allosphingosinicella sp. TaxID=2823234 RepID=UPI002EE74A04